MNLQIFGKSKCFDTHKAERSLKERRVKFQSVDLIKYGIRPGELNWEALTWERETGLFLRRGRLRCRAYFLARAEEGDTVFLDFRLKGAVTT